MKCLVMLKRLNLIDTNEVTYQLVKRLLHCYEDMKEASDNENDLVFNYICSISCHAYKI